MICVLEFSVRSNCLTRENSPRITSGSVNVVGAAFSFDALWDGYAKTAVFSASSRGVSYEVPLTNNSCVVPAEAIIAGEPLAVGVYGVLGDKRLPTIYAKPIYPLQGAMSGIDPSPVTPTQYEQLLNLIGDMSALETTNKEKLVTAINEAYANGGTVSVGNVTSESVASEAPPEVTITASAGKMDFDFKIPAGVKGADGKDGEKGNDGAQGMPGVPGTNGKDGINGNDGIDGISPLATINQTSFGATISITDKNGTTSADIINGSDGAPGVPGADGKDGADGAPGVPGKDGEDGSPGADGLPGEKGDPFTYEDFTPEQLAALKGDPGENGVSPSATIAQTDAGATITVTDVNGTTSAELTNGEKGSPGENGYTPIRGVDYWTAADVLAINTASQDYIDHQLGVIENGSY